MAHLTLTVHEWSLVQEIEAGGFKEFQTEQGKQPEIRAKALIDIILGKDVAPPEEIAGSASIGSASPSEKLDLEEKSVARPVTIRSAGIRFKNARIVGELNLQDASGAGGSMLPRLKMVSCSFEKPIRLQRARLRSLSLWGSRFSMLDISNAHIGGRVDLSGVRGIREDADSAGYYGQCWVVMVSALIEGLVIARYGRFVAPQKRPPFVRMSWFANYALDLRGADINGSVILRPRCRAMGGISITLAKIEGSVWASGAELMAVEEDAFSANYAVVRGSIYLRPYDPSNDVRAEKVESVLDISSEIEAELKLPKLSQSEPFRATGSVSLFACKLGGSLYMDGAIVRKGPVSKTNSPNEQELVDARNAEIGGDCNFSAWQCESNPEEVSRFESELNVSLDAARIRNKLMFQGARVPSVSARNIEVGGKCDFCAFYEDQPGPSLENRPMPMRFFSKGNVEITSARIGGDLLFCGAKIGEKNPQVAASPASVADQQAKNIGLSLSGSTIGGSCLIETFTYKDRKTGETCGLRFECYGVIRFSKVKITRSLRMDGARIHAKADGDRATLDLAGSFIGGDAYLRTWYKPDASESYRFEATGGRIVIGLNGTRIGQNLIMNGSRLEAKLDPIAPSRNRARSVYALSAVNANIGGKAELSTFWGKSNRSDAYLRFESTGLVSFAMATVSLGLDMKGGKLQECPLEPPEEPKLSVNAQSTKVATDDKSARALALDLSDARLKFVRLGRDQDHNVLDVTGNLNMDRTKTDAEVDLSYAHVEGELSALFVEVGEKLDLSNAVFAGAIKVRGGKIGADFVLRCTQIGNRCEADGIRVGNSVVLDMTVLPTRCIDGGIVHAIESEEGLAQKIAKGGLRTSEQKLLHKRIAELYITRELYADVSFQNGHVGHALSVKELTVHSSPAAQLDAVEIVRTAGNLYSCTIDLRGLHIGELGDMGGAGWTEHVRLWLEGFRYDRLLDISGSDEEVAQKRKRWLALQYFDPNRLTKREYSPDAYEHLVNGLRSMGAHSVARIIVSQRLKLEHQKNFLWWLFGRLFDYGYSVPKAIAVFLICIGIGWLTVYELDTQPYYPKAAPISQVTKHSSVGGEEAVASPLTGSKESASPHQTILVLKESIPEARYSYEMHDIRLVEPDKNADNHPDLVPCGDRVVPLLYALDVFLPVLNLHQEENCSIRPEATFWRVAQAIYAMLGWIVTPLTILTFSGILRRHLEK